MLNSSNMIEYRKGTPDFLKVSCDGYVRMSVHVFMELPLIHFLSGLDDDLSQYATKGVTEASISGYTEWLSTTVPTVTVGWDWRLSLAQGAPRYFREGFPRSNIMIVDTRNGRDIGDQATAERIARRIDRFGWEHDIRKQISMRYA